MAKRLALAFLAGAALLILVGSLVGGRLAAVAFAFLVMAYPVALMTLGAARGQRLGAAALPIGVLLAILELSLLVMLLFRDRVVDGPWAGGLPLAAAVQLYGVFLLPLAVTALGFAFCFHQFGVSESDLERLRALGYLP